MDNVEMAGDPSTAPRVSKRLRKRPNYYIPSRKSEHNLESDVNFRAVVTDNKGFREFRDNANFKAVSSWRLSVMLRKLERELKLDRRSNYVWAVWNEEKQKWERLISNLQLKNLETTKLRCYRPSKPKKPEPPKEPVREVPQQLDMRMCMKQMAAMAAQDMTLAYWSMFYQPWFYMPPFQ